MAEYEISLVVLPDGRVFATGGLPSSDKIVIYDPTTGVWTQTASTSYTQDYYVSAVLLPQTGEVLIIGSSGASLYDPTTEVVTPTGSPNILRIYYSVIVLDNNKVLITGGRDIYVQDPITSSELYDRDTGKWTSTGDLHEGRLQASNLIMISVSNK